MRTDRATRSGSRNLVNCCTTVGASCTTNPQHVEVMELEGYSRPTCNKPCASSHELDSRQVLLTTTFKGKYRYFSRYHNFLITQCGGTGGKQLPAKRLAQFVHPFRQNTDL